MVDPRRLAVFIRRKGADTFEDQTSEIERYQVEQSGRVRVTYRRGQSYYISRKNFVLSEIEGRISLTAGQSVWVEGFLVDQPIDVLSYVGPDGEWQRVFFKGKNASVAYHSAPARAVRFFEQSLAGEASSKRILSYWGKAVGLAGADDPIHRSFAGLEAPPGTTLASYLWGENPVERQWLKTPIFPFQCNLSQREAVENALRSSISIIQGPPGTGKTETILNIIANVVARDAGTIGLVSSNNAAVDNVREKLERRGFGHIVAGLGNRDNREAFFAAQSRRRSDLAASLERVGPRPDEDRLRAVDEDLIRIQRFERDLAGTMVELEGFRLERRHFKDHVERQQAPEIADFPLLRRSSRRIVEFLAERRNDLRTSPPGLSRRLVRYFKYGSTRNLDAGDTDVLLRLQEAFYEARITELEASLATLRRKLRKSGSENLAAEHRQLAEQVLRHGLVGRYQSFPSHDYYMSNYRQRRRFLDFARDYPVLLSTCHSLRASLPEGFVLDYLVIDEASQVDPILAGIAMSCARNLIVVGDQKQLAPIRDNRSDRLEPPARAYEVSSHSILSSLIDLLGDSVPQALLSEHYRCAPAIIGFCNKMYYGGELVPYTTSPADATETMITWRTSPGNHMRRHRDGGYSNQREAEAVIEEVARDLLDDIPVDQIGVVTPYRKQVEKIRDVVATQSMQVESDTVHRYQGRQKDAVILSTVLDQTRSGNIGLSFVDDPQLINVAVSRAAKRFVLVIEHHLLPRSRHIKDLADYIAYQNPEEPYRDSGIVSVFDLLYGEYSEKLQDLAERYDKSVRYKSEGILQTALADVLREEPYQLLTSRYQVYLRNLLSDLSPLTDREVRFVRHPATSVDFVISHAVTNRPVLAIEVDGFAFHENDPEQLERNRLKDKILGDYGLPLLRLPTTGSREKQQIRRSLNNAIGALEPWS